MNSLPDSSKFSRKMSRSLLPFLLLSCLLSSLPLSAQVSRQDLEDLERHRKPRQAVPVLQSIEDAQDTSRWDSSIIGTWDFLDAEEESQEGQAGDVTDYAVDWNRTTIQQRVFTLPQELLIPYNDELESFIRSYVVRHAKPLRSILGKYDYYEKAIRSAFARHGLPEDLTALAIVESAMNTRALSRAGARGMWQFMPETARRYGLRCDYSVDERLDPYRSADAAARYLKAAYARFGDWPLAISSYNCGPGTVENAILRANSTDFWKIYPYLPRETRGYMPAFVAALYSIEFHDLHGITPKAYGEGSVTNFRITRNMTFKEIIRATGVPSSELVRLNPQYMTGDIPGYQKNYILRLPKKYAKLFKDNIDIVNAD